MLSHVTGEGRPHGVRIIDISPLGLMCRSDNALPIGDRISIWLPLVKDHDAHIRWVEDGRIGLEFVEPIAPLIYQQMLALIPPRRSAW